jgi:chromosome segregation ATPase
VAYEEREYSMKRSMDDAISELQHIKSVYAGGLTAEHAMSLKGDNDALQSELAEAKKAMLEYKHIADLSASQASTLLSMKTRDKKNIDNALMNPSCPILASSSAELEQCESKLADAQNQVMMLQNTCKALISLVQKITKSNWYHHSPINQGLIRLSDCLKAENDLATSAASKLSVLIETVDSLESKSKENEAAIETLMHEKELLETRLSRFEGSGILNRNCEHNDLLHQLTDTKSKLFAAQRELRQSSHQIMLLEAKNGLLERSNSQLEKDAAYAELILANDHNSHSDIITSLFSLQFGEGNEETDQAIGALKKVGGALSRYVDEMKSLYSVYSSLQAHRVESVRVECLNNLVKEKDRIISALEQKLAQAKQDRNATRAPRHRGADDSSCSFGTISSLANLAKCSPKRSFYEARLEEATKLISRKDNELKDMSRFVSELEEDNLCMSKQLDSTSKQSELFKADISTLVSRLNEKESMIAELEKELSIQKQMHQDSIASSKQTAAENEKMKNQMGNHAKKSKEIEARIKTVENDLARTKRILSVARQGKARSEALIKEITAKEEAAQEEITKLNKELNDVKTKLITATEDKVAASRKSRAATTKLKALTERFDPHAHEKVKADLEQRVAVLNQTVSGLASQNSKLRSKLGILKKEKEESLEQIKRPNISKDRSSSRVAICKQCKTLEARISSLEKLLASEQTISADQKQMLQMYQQRALRTQNQEESKMPLSRPLSASKRVEELKKQIGVITKENEDLQVKLKQMTAARDKLSSQLEAFGTFFS